MRAITLLFILCSFELICQEFKSTLPLVIINTSGQFIPDAYKINVDMKIIHDENKSMNSSYDAANIYSGKIGIETRGSSSQFLFPKKSYGFETRVSGETENEVSLFGWPEESDYILYASYNDKSLMNNVLTMKLANEMGMYASRTRYVDVVLDNEYLGLFVMMEKVKRAKGRVDIAKLDSADVAGDEITGGYILKIDKNTGTNLGGFTSDYNVTGGFIKHMFQYDAPKSIHGVQKKYIENYIRDFEDALAGPNFTDANFGYSKYIDESSFIKMFIINEVAGNVDAYRISTFLYKDKDSKGGKLTIGPPWDYDLSYGNADYCGAPSYSIFSYQFNSRCPQDGYQVPFWWDRLLQDTSFRKKLYEEYHLQRTEGALQWNNITSIVDSLRQELKAAQSNNFSLWPVLGQYVWPNPQPVPATWEGEINELLTWLSNRLAWLDGRMENLVSTNEVVKFSIQLSPNPVVESTSLIISSPKNQRAKFDVYDLNGKVVSLKETLLIRGTNKFNFMDEIVDGPLLPGLYLVRVRVGDESYNYKLIK